VGLNPIHTAFNVFGGAFVSVILHFLMMSAVPAPKWIVECRSCSANIIHSEVGADRTAADYVRPTARKFSLLGEEMECPKCKTKATYKPEDLKYQPS
jgi:hypothetical protein